MSAHPRTQPNAGDAPAGAAAEDFATVVRTHHAALRGFLLRLTRDYDQADELAQEVFVIMHAKLAGFEGRGSFNAWMYRIAYNCFLQQRRAQARRREVLAEYHAELQVDPARYEDISARQVELEQALARISPAEAAAITLCHGQGFSHQEVASILQMPLGTVKSNIARGLEKLRRLLASADERSPK